MFKTLLTILSFVALNGALNTFYCDENKSSSSPYATVCTISNLHLVPRSKHSFSHNYLASTIIFKDSNIPSLPHEFLARLQPEKVFIESVSLQDLTPYTFNGAKYLKELHASDNEIITLEEKTFVGARSLILLDLSDNKINTIHDAALEGLPNLKWISLKGNQLKTFRNDWFVFSTNFEHINLSKNHFASTILNFERLDLLASLDISQMSAASNLQAKLSCMNINSIDVSGSVALQFLVVSCAHFGHRELTLVADETKLGISNPSLFVDPRVQLTNLHIDNTAYRRFEELSSFTTLKYLSMEGNDFRELSAAFQTLTPALEQLSLHGNLLNAINGTIFEKFKNLKVLDLGGMEFNEIHFDEFKGLSKVEELYLNDIGLKDINEAALLKAFPNLKFINLRGNEINEEDQKSLRHLFNAAGISFAF